MRVEQKLWDPDSGWVTDSGGRSVQNPQLVMFFSAPELVHRSELFDEIRVQYPNACIVGCTTGGEIIGDEVLDGTIVVSAVEFDNTQVRVASVDVANGEGSRACGAAVARDLMAPDLKTILVFSDGTVVNGSALVLGIVDVVGREMPIAGGMAGDGDRFGTTHVGLNGELKPDTVCAVGLYGDSIRVRHGSFGGWDVFGPERKITKSDGNILYELDGLPALGLYKKYLGPEAENLPISGLRFPLRVRENDADQSAVVRTIVGVDEEHQSLTFAGNVPTGHVAQLMRGNFESLIEGAERAAISAATMGESSGQEDKLGILVSCIGRKLVLGQRVGEEIEAVGSVLGPSCSRIGYYSYGEISPHESSGFCELHNQTMTITVLSEVASE